MDHDVLARLSRRPNTCSSEVAVQRDTRGVRGSRTLRACWWRRRHAATTTTAAATAGVAGGTADGNRVITLLDVHRKRVCGSNGRIGHRRVGDAQLETSRFGILDLVPGGSAVHGLIPIDARIISLHWIDVLTAGRHRVGVGEYVPRRDEGHVDTRLSVKADNLIARSCYVRRQVVLLATVDVRGDVRADAVRGFNKQVSSPRNF